MSYSFTILLVDDDIEDAEIFASAVSEIDKTIKCHTTTNGLDALKSLRVENASLPDIIFLDLNMPCFDGKQFLRERNKIEKLLHIPVVVYSTTRRKKDIDEVMELGAAYFLTKPVQYSQICKELTGILTKVKEKAM